MRNLALVRTNIYESFVLIKIDGDENEWNDCVKNFASGRRLASTLSSGICLPAIHHLAANVWMVSRIEDIIIIFYCRLFFFFFRVLIFVSITVILTCILISVLMVVCCFWSRCPLFDLCWVNYSKRGVIAYSKCHLFKPRKGHLRIVRHSLAMASIEIYQPLDNFPRGCRIWPQE